MHLTLHGDVTDLCLLTIRAQKKNDRMLGNNNIWLR